MDADVPSMPAEVSAVFDDTNHFAIMDIGGDASGARVLAQYRHKINLDEMRLICILNANRPMTPDAQSMVNYVHSIEAACGLRVNGLINNSHQCNETTAETVAEGADIARKVSEMLDIPLVCHSLDRRIVDALVCEHPDNIYDILHVKEKELIYPINIFMKKPWE